MALENTVQLSEKYEAVMVLSGVGDDLGYKNGLWEFCYSGTQIHEELEKLGGLDKIDIKGWRVSDDTVLHIATAEALVSEWTTTEELLSIMATKYKKTCAEDMWERAPGQTTTKACFMLQPLEEKGYIIPFNERGGGCGAAMRSMCIGLMFPCEDQIEMLIEIAVESGRMTHNHPTGYLGAVTVALFTAYAIQKMAPKKWGAGLLSVLPKVWEYIEKVGRDVEENKKSWGYFKNSWESYLELRGLTNGTSEPKFPVTYNIPERDAFYKSVSYAGWGGSSGHDAPMIAYDALMMAKDSWFQLCSCSMFHGGDSDSTGILAAAWWGGMYGMKGVPLGNYRNLEYGHRLMELGKKLLNVSKNMKN
ncbi:protein ADP-ribosylarginine hydrolase-like [Xenia sp. Carnegie-2017]|uniref:protein ADP-ribosylarginine hydrolase-like n=1 Tax=Xenia sp. Carnegie-2017 TaxID=2897299 RepID=UPI001F04EF18|nr:protein ADP-ribosylarginine hydrolase-like [Xenia sp. Carnegie-2017]